MTTGARVTPDPTAADPPEPHKSDQTRRQPPPVDAATHEDWDPVASDDWTEDDVLAETPAPLVGDASVEAGPVVPEPSTWLPLVEGHSPRRTICPFLRAVDADDTVGFPIESPDPGNRCAALADVVPQSLRQQELVCLTASHVNCPRYLRGAIQVSSVPAVRPRIIGKPALTPAIAASLGILALSFATSVAFGLANGGLVLPSSAIHTPVPVAIASASASAVAIASPIPSPTQVTGSVAPVTAPPSTSPSPTPPATPSPTSSPTPAPTPKPTKAPPKSSRFALLTKCPGKSNCYIYRIRSGDNLFSIANYFGVSLSKVKALNPWTKTERLSTGRQLILPTPTR
jgi:LysM domain